MKTGRRRKVILRKKEAKAKYGEFVSNWISASKETRRRRRKKKKSGI